MGIARLGHYSIRTRDLETSLHFYRRVLGFRAGYRPPFPFPGAWLYAGGDESDFGVVHLIGEDEGRGLRDYLGARESLCSGNGAIDHVAFLATDWPETALGAMQRVFAIRCARYRHSGFCRCS